MLAIPIPTGPANVDVAVVEVAVIKPAINLPYAVVEASVALEVATSVPNMPLDAENNEAKSAVVVAYVVVELVALRFTNVCVPLHELSVVVPNASERLFDENKSG